MNQLSYIPIAEAVDRPGLRVAFTQGVPGPWGLAARVILEYKNIPFTATPQQAGEPNEALQRWTGQNSAPVAMLDKERPRALWSEILLLAERLAPNPPLIPSDPDARALMFGLAHEMCGEDGLGWSARVLLFESMRRAGVEAYPMLVTKYASGRTVEHAAMRLNAVLDVLARRLDAQRGRGGGFLVGEALTAADIYWMAFSNLLAGFPQEVCVMPDDYRSLGDRLAPFLDAQLPQILLEHRDRIARLCMRMPMAF